MSKIIYTPDPPVHNPIKLFKTMGKALLESRELAWAIFVRETAAQYRQSFLGIFWAFLTPLVTSLIFIILQRRVIVNLGKTDVPYPVFVLTGTILWQLFNESINAPLKVVISSKPILAKISIPYEALILSAFYQTLLNSLIKFAVLIIALFLLGLHLNLSMLLSVPVIFLLVMLGITLGLVLTPIGMLYNDIQTGLAMILQLWFFVTPVVYSVPSSFPFSLISVINPVSPFLTASRDLITKGSIGNFDIVLFYSLGMIILFLFAWIIYRISMPIIVERMSA